MKLLPVIQAGELPRAPVRFSTGAERQDRQLVHVVWELTLACDLKCVHCGSRAGRRRPNELNTVECIEVVDQLARLGTREISLIGGEAYLRRDLPEIIRAIHDHGIYCGIQTGGRNFTDKRLDAVVAAGLNGLGVSLDGLEDLHDSLRGVKGSFAAAVSTLRRAKERGLNISVNTQIGSRTMPDLPGLFELLIESKVTHWQVQLTVAIGNAVDHAEELLQPYELKGLMPTLVDLYQKGLARGLLLEPGNNIGYFGPYEHIWREGTEGRQHWSGCQAGETGLGLEADGTIKGCPSLSTARYGVGNIRDMPIEQTWRRNADLRSVRPQARELWGFCGTCYYAPVCSAGCTWTGQSLLGRPGNNPYCHHRVLELARQGLRERIAKVEEAPDRPFATGRFQVLVEDGAGNPVDQRTVAIGPTSNLKAGDELVLCGHCLRFIAPDESSCPFCGTGVDIAMAEMRAERSARGEAMAALGAVLRKA